MTRSSRLESGVKTRPRTRKSDPPMADKLETYQRMRRFNQTPEPSGQKVAKVRCVSKKAQASALSFVI
ncbi:MAG: hypothetical protein CBARDMAM_2525 [uncultured Caballeronia sp.]|nr:MAG: hypothetical protein CBARDMAM_2525 [uncultured Caballeronia sp.]